MTGSRPMGGEKCRLDRAGKQKYPDRALWEEQKCPWIGRENRNTLNAPYERSRSAARIGRENRKNRIAPYGRSRSAARIGRENRNTRIASYGRPCTLCKIRKLSHGHFVYVHEFSEK